MFCFAWWDICFCSRLINYIILTTSRVKHRLILFLTFTILNYETWWWHSLLYVIWGCKKDFRVFPRYEEQGPLNKWPWKYQVKVITQGHIVGPTSHRLTTLPFHANRPSYSWDTAFSKSDLGNSMSCQGHWEGGKDSKLQSEVCPTSYRFTSPPPPCRPLPIGLPIHLMIRLFQHLALKI